MSGSQIAGRPSSPLYYRLPISTFRILSDTQRIRDGQPLQNRSLSAFVAGAAFALLGRLHDEPAKEALCRSKILRAAAAHDLGEKFCTTLPTNAGS